MITAREIAETLGRGKEVKTSNDSWNTICPAHNDRGPSLSVSESGGRILVKCHAGCEQSAVIEALRDMDLWPKAGRHRTWRALNTVPDGTMPPASQAHYKFGMPSKRWEYRNKLNQLVGFIYRFDRPGGGKELMPLTWCQAEEDGELAWRWKSFNKPRPLYNEHLLPRHKDKPVLVVEGEKTADAATKLFEDYVVVTWPGGGNAVRFVNWEVLKGRDVTIWPDADGPGLKCATSLAEILVEVEAKAIRLIQPPEGLPEGWDLADDLPEDLQFDRRSLVITAQEFQPSGDTVIDRLNQHLALTILGDKSVVIWERWDPIRQRNVPSYVGLSAVKAYYANEFVSVGRNEKPVIDFWMQHPKRKSYSNVVFEPGVETPQYYNLWRGFTYTPDPTGDWSIFEEHLRQNVAQGNEELYYWIIGWFAQMLQNPQRKPGTSLAIRGRQGSGKTVVGTHMGALIRDNYVLVDDERYVTGQFNSHMAHALLLQADEGFFAGDPRHIGRLKGIVTSQTNRIEYKGKDSFEINNYMRLFITSNVDWIVPAAFEERRFAVIDCGEGRMQDRAYFSAMERQLLNGGYEGLLHYLLNFDLSTVDVGVIPDTAALSDQKQYSLTTVQRYWFERLQAGEARPNLGKWDNVASEDLYNDYVHRAQQWGIPRRSAQTQFGRELGNLIPGKHLQRARQNVAITNERGGVEMRRVWVYKLPDLESCRRAFEEELGTHVDWKEFDGELIEELPPNHEDDIPF